MYFFNFDDFLFNSSYLYNIYYFFEHNHSCLVFQFPYYDIITLLLLTQTLIFHLFIYLFIICFYYCIKQKHFSFIYSKSFSSIKKFVAAYTLKSALCSLRSALCSLKCITIFKKCVVMFKSKWNFENFQLAVIGKIKDKY